MNIKKIVKYTKVRFNLGGFSFGLGFSHPSLYPLAPTEVEILFVFFSKTKRLERMAGTNLY
jgi:hypothetical protein